MRRKEIILLGMTLLACFEMSAQEQLKDSTLNRTVVVENQYNPEIMDAFKVNVLPEIEEPTVPKRHIDYATNSRLLTGWRSSLMPAITAREEQRDVYRGYLRLAYGNRNNTDLKAGYLWDITERDRLNVMGSLYGMKGDIPSLNADENWNSRFFRTDISLDYKHDFRKVSLGLGGVFASQVFNYMPGDENNVGNGTSLSDKQHYTLGEGYLRVTSKDDDLPVQFSLQSGFRMFDRKYALPYATEDSEQSVHTEGGISGNIDERQEVGLSFAMDNMFYGDLLKDYTLVQINPYYVIRNEAIRFRAGVHVDGQTANGSGIKVAPDVKFDFVFAEHYRFYAHATGGTALNDYRSLNGLTPYWLQSEQLHSSYTPVNARVGFKASPLIGLGLELFGGYRVTKDELFVLPGAADGYTNYLYSSLLQEKATVAYGGGALNYTYKDWLDFAVDGTYYNWDADVEGREYLLYLKPRFELNVSLHARIVGDAYAEAGYHYQNRKAVDDLKAAAAVNDLRLSAGYCFFNRLDVFGRIENLLNKKYILDTGYPVQGFTVLGGINFRF